VEPDDDYYIWGYEADNSVSDFEAVCVALAAAGIICGLVLIGIGVFNG